MKLPSCLCLGTNLILLSLFSTVSAHGYSLNPPARQHLCANAGGNWWPEDGSGIPNAACRAAYSVTSDPMLYTQVHEYAVNIADYRNPSAVRAKLSDGLLCSAGQTRYKGMSIAHADWQKTPVSLGGGHYTLTFNASVPHDPSFFEIYLTKPGFDSSTQTLSWGNLELLGAFEDIKLKTAGHDRYYEMTIDLPSNRQDGDSAILFTRWQRIDRAGEGFYNCSDIVFSAQTPTEPVTPTPPTPDPTPTPPVPTPDPVDPVNPNPTEPGDDLEVVFSTQTNWDTGFNGVIHITNRGTAISDWVLSFRLAGAAAVSETVWGAGGAIHRDSGGTVTITPNTWGGSTIRAGETVSIYYGGTGVHRGADICVINGAVCE